MRVLFVGSNPSNMSATSTAFHGGTKSYTILSGWTKDLDIDKVYANVSNSKTENNRPLTVNEIRMSLSNLEADIIIANADKIVALGKTAAKALSMLKVEFCEMPHPSGRNRLLNDPQYVQQKIKELAQFCQASPITLSTKS